MIGDAALGIWMDVDPAGLDDFNAWYRRQHLPERLSVPGFLRGRRYQTTGEGPVYFTLYETADAAVLSSAAYLERLNNPTDWTRRALPTTGASKQRSGANRASDRIPRDGVPYDRAVGLRRRGDTAHAQPDERGGRPRRPGPLLGVLRALPRRRPEGHDAGPAVPRRHLRAGAPFRRRVPGGRS